jgi:hypothetical protein
MAEQQTLIRHKLSYFSHLKVDNNIFTLRFSNGCSMYNCKGNCCRYGVWADIEEKKNILDHSEMIIRYMEPFQEKNPQQWFEPENVDDKDFPSGIAVGTQIRDTGCVFLDSNGRCVLQKAAMAEGMDRFALKPFYCVAYPITIDNSVLMYDDDQYPDNPHCCSPRSEGSMTVFDICSEELEFTVGQEGLQELRETAASKI